MLLEGFRGILRVGFVCWGRAGGRGVYMWTCWLVEKFVEFVNCGSLGEKLS